MDFNKIIDRKGTYSEKWDNLEKYYKRNDLLSMWVADMDFQCPKEVIDATTIVSKHGIYGYSSPDDSYFDAVINWFYTRHGVSINKKHIITSPGVVTGITNCVQALTEIGDGIIIQKPVYFPFSSIVINNQRTLVNNALIYKDGKYEIDFDDFEKKAKDTNNKMFIFCSPHNPVGRVWKKNEVEKLAKICFENGLIFISDEIHCDLVFKGNKHISYMSLKKDIRQNGITLTAPSKTFNMPGLYLSNIVVENAKMRSKLKDNLNKKNAIHMVTPFSIAAAKAAYSQCGYWVDEIMDYLYENYMYVKSSLEDKTNIRVCKLEGTYLVWLDFSKCNMKHKRLKDIMVSELKLALSDGKIFGDEGANFMRMNIGTPKENVEKAIKRILTIDEFRK